MEPIFVFINEFVVEGALGAGRYCDCGIQFSMQIDEGFSKQACNNTNLNKEQKKRTDTSFAFPGQPRP